MLKQGIRLNVFAIRRFGPKGEETTWSRAGSAWINRDGSMNLKLDVLPIGGELHVREPTEDKRETTNHANAQRESVSSDQTNSPPLEAADASASMGGH